MTVGGAFVYVCDNCERGRVKEFEQRSRYITRSVITLFFPMDPEHRVIMESQCTSKLYFSGVMT